MRARQQRRQCCLRRVSSYRPAAITTRPAVVVPCGRYSAYSRAPTSVQTTRYDAAKGTTARTGPVRRPRLRTAGTRPGSIIAAIIVAHRATKNANEPSRVATPMSMPRIWPTVTNQAAAATPRVAASVATVRYATFMLRIISGTRDIRNPTVAYWWRAVMALALAFHFSIPVAGAHAGPDADAALGGAGFVARDRAPARAACREDLQAHAGTRSVREGLERGRVGRVACEIDLLGRDEVPQIGAHLRFVRALLPPPQRGLQIRAEVLDADHTPSPGGALHPQVYDERRIGIYRADANADPGDLAALLYTSEALVTAFKSRQRVEQRGPDALLDRNDQRGLQGRIRGPQRAGGGARLIHDGLGGAPDIEELLDPGSVLGPYGVLELLERLEGRAPSLPGPPRDERCARDDERASGEQREMDARHGRLLLGTEYYAFPAQEVRRVHPCCRHRRGRRTALRVWRSRHVPLRALVGRGRVREANRWHPDRHAARQCGTVLDWT